MFWLRKKKVKFLLPTRNLSPDLPYIFQLLGFGVLTVGIWTHLNRGPYGTLLPNSSFLSATTLTIAAGAIIFIVGFCGCCSAMMESQCMLVVVSKKIISFV